MPAGCPRHQRATYRPGRQKVNDSAPGHVATVRHHVIDALTAEQVHQLADITAAMLHRLDPEGKLTAIHNRSDP